MNSGDFFIVFFVGIIFFGGLYVGYKLYIWNLKDLREKKKRNENLKNKKK